MKIAFATFYDLKNIKKGSGTYYNIYMELLNQNHKVFPIGPLDVSFPFLSKLFRYIAKRVLKKRYRSYQDPFVGFAIGKQINALLKDLDYDFLLTNDYTIAGYTKINKPIVLWTDAVFPVDYKKNIHPRLDNLPWFSVYFCQKVIKEALRNIDLCIVPADWNYKEILNYDKINHNNIRKIPFGSNMRDPGPKVSKERNFEKIIQKKEIDILFIGIDWKRKGGDIAIQVVKRLNKKGYKARLSIVGDSDKSIEGKFINNYGYLDKKNNNDLEKLDSLYRESDILLLPSSIEGFGIAFVEAASYGLPSLAFDNTGVSTAVKNGKSGFLIGENESPNQFVKIIISFFENPNNYNDLVNGSRLHYEDIYNWTSCVNRFIKLVESTF